MKRIAFILLLIVPALLWAYTPPTAYVEKADRVFTQVGQELELLKASDPNAIKYARSFSRAWLKNGDTFEVVVRVNGTIEQIVATGEAKCEATEVQPVYVKARIERPCKSAPADPSLEVIEP